MRPCQGFQKNERFTMASIFPGLPYEKVPRWLMREPKTRFGLTLIEIMIASVILSLALLSLFLINTSSNQLTLDSYFELLAVQIAQEPLEVFKAVGYPECLKLEKYPLGSPVNMTAENGRYPVEASMFERTITIDASTEPLYVVTVSVTPIQNTKAETWLRKRKSCITLKGIIPLYK